MMLTSVNSTSAVIASSSGRLSLDELTVRLVAVPSPACQDLPDTRQFFTRVTCNCVSLARRARLEAVSDFPTHRSYPWASRIVSGSYILAYSALVFHPSVA